MSNVTEKDRELVLCVSRPCVERLFRGAKGPWLPIEDEGVIGSWLAKATVAFLPRSIAEHTSDWLHFATYCVLTDGANIFSYRRGTSGSEARLHGKISIGVGGHVGIDDYDCDDQVSEDMLAIAALRETDEELEAIGPMVGFGLRGFIVDGSSPVNAVHVGAVYCPRVDPGRVRVREDCLIEPRWLTLDELRAERGDLETWSAIVLEHLLLPERSPA